MKKNDLLKNRFISEQIYLKSRYFSCYSKNLGYLKNLMIERMIDQQDWYEENEISESPYGANPARFSINELNSELFYYCVFKHLDANSNMVFITALRSDKQEYFHGGDPTVNHYVYNPNDIRESHYLYIKIISNINEKLKNTKNIKNNNQLEEDNFYLNPIEDNLQEIQIFYILTDSNLNFEMTNKYPFSPVYASKSKINRTINSNTGLLNKIGINKWFKMNYINIQNKPNNYFLDKYLLQKDKFDSLIKFNIPKNLNFYFYQSFYHLINNNLIKKKNYILYLKNIPVNILLIICKQKINSYYCDILHSPKENLGYSNNSFKYDIVSLYHDLGNRIVLYCLKYLYSQYLTQNNINLRYDNYNNLILLNSTKTDFLSFTEFKNKTIKEFFDLDTDDLIELGRDLYLFTIFNYYLCENSSNFSSYNLNNKSLTITFPINVNYINFYYPSRNKINNMLLTNSPLP